MANTLREIGSNIARLRASLAETKKDLLHIRTLQDALQEVLTPMWESTEVETMSNSSVSWKEFLSLVASGKIITVSAQAEEALSASKELRNRSWIGDGLAYAKWIGNGVASLARRRGKETDNDKVWKPVAELLGKSFSIGYTDDVVDAVITRLILEDQCELRRMQNIVRQLARHEQRQFLTSVIRMLSKRHLPSTTVEKRSSQPSEERIVAACARLLECVVSVNEPLMSQQLSAWLARTPIASIGLYRAVIAALPKQERENVLEKAWMNFSDKLYIKHAAVAQQEALTLILLLCAGVVHRETPMQVYMLAHSSFQTSGISDRLSSTSQRARFLGMALGTMISQLVDKLETRMTFDFDDDEKSQLAFFQSLLHVDFKLGDLTDLRSKTTSQSDVTTLVMRTKPTKQPKAGPKSKAPAPKVMVVDDDEDEEDDLVPFAKPDSDAEDSDEDATVARRDKPKAPVYIRDLLTRLQNTEDHDIHLQALQTGSSLIRRKATFGAELADQAPALASTYAELQDPFGVPDFHDLRLQGMIALLVALPKELGPWFAASVFGGEYSIGQRVALMTAIGLAGRELAGFGREGGGAEDGERESFPSKTLPERLHRMYAQDSEMTALARRMEESVLTPVATKQRPRRKVVKNELAKVVAESFFLPLTAAFRERGAGGTNSKHLLPPFLQTLTLLLTLSSRSTPHLPLLTTDLWTLLLSLRTRSISDPATLEALLFGFLSILDAHDNKRGLAEEWGKLLLETHQWVEVVFERLENSGVRGGLMTSGDACGAMGKDDQGQRCRMLAAGVLMATKEVVEAYDRLLLGDMVDFRG